MSSPSIQESEKGHFVGSSYCSLGRVPALPIKTLRQGLDLIILILSKEVLCRHDVEDLNRIYEQMDLLERKLEKIPLEGTFKALDQITKKIVTIATKIIKNEKITPNEVITFYNLTYFTHEQLPLSVVFDAYFNHHLKKRPEVHKLAFALPFCVSESDFEKSVVSLIGRLPEVSASTPETFKKAREERKVRAQEEKLLEQQHRERLAQKYLEQKKSAFKQAEVKRRLLEDRIKELPALQKQYAEKYPPYLMELLQNGYLTLYDHLVAMQNIGAIVDRSKNILENMSFHDAAKVILETREAIIQKVKRELPQNCSKVAILTGGSGVGKSTSLCFLRGDKMVLNRDNQYESAHDRDKSIGHSDKTSCTFLPNIELIGDLGIIDFPGFNDTNGPLVSLGMELALKALIKTYHPRILVFESITNTQGKYDAVARLAARLNRIMGSKANCLLGLTKYAQDASVIALKNIEQEERKALITKTPAEIGLEAQIEGFARAIKQTPAVAAALNPLIEKAEAELLKLQEAKAKIKATPLPDSEEKSHLRQKIKAVEENIKRETGLSEIISFGDLHDTMCLNLCLDKLAQPALVDDSISSFLRFDAEHRRLLDDLFETKLVPQLDAKKFDTKDERFEHLERTVLEKSLIFTLTQDDSPEIGTFFHLPEVDQALVREYDQQVVYNFNKKYTQQVISGFNISVVKSLVAECRQPVNKEKYKETGETLVRIEAKLEELQTYIMARLGRTKENSQEVATEWAAIQKEFQSIEEEFEFPLWGQILLGVPLGIPWGIYWFWKKQKTMVEQLKFMVEQAAVYEKTIDDLTKVLVKLNNLEYQIRKRSAIDEDFNKRPIVLDNYQAVVKSVRDRIESVRIQYGSMLWDKRVERLVSEMFPEHFLIPKEGNVDPHFLDEAKRVEKNLYQLIPQNIEMILASLFDPDIIWKVVKKEAGATQKTEKFYSFKNFKFQENLEENPTQSPRRVKEPDLAAAPVALLELEDAMSETSLLRSTSFKGLEKETKEEKELQESTAALKEPGWTALAKGVILFPGFILGAAAKKVQEMLVEEAQPIPSIYTGLVRQRDLQAKDFMYAEDYTEHLKTAWNLIILPRLSELIEARTPINLALLGAVLLKKWRKL